MKNLTDYIAEAYEYNYNISNVPKYTSTGTDKVDIKNKTNNKTNYTVQPKNKDELMYIITSTFKIKQYDLNFIDTSKITDMSELFININHNFDVSKWDVSNVTNMSAMFYCCYDFICDLSKWNVSSVTNMHSLFRRCNKFTGKGLENWDISNVTTMSGMFNKCDNFNCDLSKWNVSNVENMSYMFNKCYKFEGKGLENWDVSNLKRRQNMFNECTKLTCDLSSWQY